MDDWLQGQRQLYQTEIDMKEVVCRDPHESTLIDILLQMASVLEHALNETGEWLVTPVDHSWDIKAKRLSSWSSPEAAFELTLYFIPGRS